MDTRGGKSLTYLLVHIVDLDVDANVDICVASCFIFVGVMLDPRRTAFYPHIGVVRIVTLLIILFR